MNYFEAVGQNILAALHQTQMERKELADKLGVSRQMLQKILKGQKAINVMEISRIASVLGVPVDVLLRNQQESCLSAPTLAVQYMGSPSTQGSVGFIQRIFDEYVRLEDRHHEPE